MTLNKRTRKTAILGSLFLFGALTGFFARKLEPLPPQALVVLTVIVGLIITWASIYCWRLLDEAQREAHKWAWYWGGSLGLALGFAVVMIALRISPELAALVHRETTATHLLLDGYVAAMVSTLIGYGVAWIYWWLKRR